MNKLSSPTRLAYLAFSWLSLSAYASAAQVQYGSTVSDQSGLVDAPSGAADGNLATKATLKPTALLTSPRLRVKFNALATAGKPAGVYLKTDNALTLALLGTASIRTYLGTQEVERYNVANEVLSLAVQNTDVKNLTFTPTKAFDQIQVDYISLAAIGKDIEFYEAYSTVVPLPVTLLSFEAKASSTGVALSWNTASELNFGDFVVERAEGAADNFRAIGRVHSAGNSTRARHYSFVDAAPGRINYYRLRQVDLDGSETFSAVVVLSTEALAGQLAAYPSPTVETLTVTGPAGTPFTIVNHLGQPVHSAILPPSQRQQVDVRGLPSGIYYVREGSGKSQKFIKIAALR
jgi:hypothetical protein